MSHRKHQSDSERLYLLVQHLGRRLRDIDLAHDISPSRFAVLAHLAFHGADNVGELAAAERVSRPAMTRLVRDMERSGLLRKAADSTDGRGVRAELTAKGRATLERVRQDKIALVREYIDALDAASLNALKLALTGLEVPGITPPGSRK